jgi:hypothetical protein
VRVRVRVRLLGYMLKAALSFSGRPAFVIANQAGTRPAARIANKLGQAWDDAPLSFLVGRGRPLGRSEGGLYAMSAASVSKSGERAGEVILQHMDA